MTEAEWMNCTDALAMLDYLRGKASNRKLRLFACALARRVWPLLGTARIRRAVELAERFADGAASKREMTAAGAAAQQSAWSVSYGAPRFKNAVIAGAFATARYAAYAMLWEGVASACRESERAKVTSICRCGILRDIFGNPFRTAPILYGVLAWNDAVVVRLAQNIYEERHLPEGTLDNDRLLILADALEEAGCADVEMISHCRSEVEHVRGCWVIDRLQGKS